MTTVACDGKVMAADGRMASMGSIVTDKAVKVYRLNDGTIIGFCGYTDEAPAVIEWFNNGGDKPTVDDNFCALRLDHDGVITKIVKGMHADTIDAPAAIGSGGEIALGAMLAGAHAPAAVGLAMTRDIASGGTITVMAPGDGDQG